MVIEKVNEPLPPTSVPSQESTPTPQATPTTVPSTPVPSQITNISGIDTKVPLNTRPPTQCGNCIYSVSHVDPTKIPADNLKNTNSPTAIPTHAMKVQSAYRKSVKVASASAIASTSATPTQKPKVVKKAMQKVATKPTLAHSFFQWLQNMFHR